MSPIDELVDRFFEDDLSDDETRQLAAWLEAPENLEHFVARAELHADLNRSLNRRRIQSDAEATCDPDRLRMPEKAPATAQVMPRPGTGVRLAAVVISIAAILLLALSIDFGRREVTTTDLKIANVVGRVNAVLTRTETASPLQSSDLQGSDLTAGSYQLQKGLLHLRFDGGVMVYVEAPARFEAVNGKHLLLFSGRLTASVPPEGIGFTVSTPEAEVIDFGTEFSVDVGVGASEVHVFDGLVQVTPKSAEGAPSKAAVELRSSQAVKIDGARARPVDIALARDRFIRDFEEPKRKHARSVKKLSPVAFYRMPIRDRGLVSEPPEYTGVVLIGDGVRPPHARGVFTGGSLRVLAESSGRGGRVDDAPSLDKGRLTVAAFVYLEGNKRASADERTIVTNLSKERGNVELSLEKSGVIRASVRSKTGEIVSVAGESRLPRNTWRQIVVTADGEQLRLYEDGSLVAEDACGDIASSEADIFWFGTDPDGQKLWSGRIDEVALFDKAIEGQDIADLFDDAQEELLRSP